MADRDGILLAVVARLDVLTTESLSVLSPIFFRMAVLPTFDLAATDVDDDDDDVGLDTGVDVDKDFRPRG